MSSTITDFEDLEVWQESQNLAVDIYRITKSFPSDEKFGITNQLRRAASSISANIAEGFGRTSPKDKLRFYQIGYGSLLEVKSFLHLSQRLDYIDDAKTEELLSQAVSCQKLLNAFMRPLRNA